MKAQDNNKNEMKRLKKQIELLKDTLSTCRQHLAESTERCSELTKDNDMLKDKIITLKCEIYDLIENGIKNHFQKNAS